MAALGTVKVLSRPQIEEAKGDRSHPAIITFDSLEGHWKDLKRQLRRSDDPYEQHIICQEGMIAFSQALQGKEFTLEPLEVVSIWSRARELFKAPVYFGYELSASLASAYSAIPIDSPAWKAVYEGMAIDPTYLQRLTASDMPNAAVFSVRLHQLNSNLDALVPHLLRDEIGSGSYFAGTNGLQKTKEPKVDPIIDAIRENWGNGFTVLFLGTEIAHDGA